LSIFTSWANQKRLDDGQTLVEFAFVLPVLLLILFGIIEFGWIFMQYVQVIHAAREGTRYASTDPYSADANPNSDICAKIESAATYFGGAVSCKKTQTEFDVAMPDQPRVMWVLVTPEPDASGTPPISELRQPGYSIHIYVKAHLALLTPLLEPVFGGHDYIRLSTDALMTIIE